MDCTLGIMEDRVRVMEDSMMFMEDNRRDMEDRVVHMEDKVILTGERVIHMEDIISGAVGGELCIMMGVIVTEDKVTDMEDKTLPM